MKKLLLLIITLFLTAQTIKAQTVVLDTNGVTVKWTGTTVPTPYFVQANPRGTGMEWFAIVNNSKKIYITEYAKNSQSGRTYFTPPNSTTPIPFNNIVTTLVTIMDAIFKSSTSQNQAITSFNQPIGSWDTSNVNSMWQMFDAATSFNQPIGYWNMSNVNNIGSMFRRASTFNQPIGSWNVSNVTTTAYMFNEATSFNQPIGSWNVTNVNTMIGMFAVATSFNQPIGSWNVINVNSMNGMFDAAQLSTANYDATLLEWSTKNLKRNVTFSGGNSKYCNGASARSSIISTYGWTITDGGLDCSSLDTETFETNSLKLYPNPVVSVLNVKTDNNLINQPYTIIDGLGRIVLNGKINDVESTINVEQLSKGIYYLKITGNRAIKFIKE